MNFFITRPIFATSLALILVLAGTISGFLLPVSQYPALAPPQVSVTASYPGASAQVVADSVTTVLEEQINGAEGMIYMSSSSTNAGQSTITVTFEIGTDPRIAQVEVQNRESWGGPELPTEVTMNGVTVNKVSQDLMLAVALISPNGTYDQAYLGNYADIHVIDALNRIPGIAQVLNFGLQRYAMRIWLDPAKLSQLGFLASDVSDAIRDQNQQVAAGQLGQAPAPANQAFTFQLQAEGRLSQVEEFEDIILRADPDGSIVRIRDVARVELGAEDYDSSFHLNGTPAGSLGIFQLPDADALQLRQDVGETMERLAQYFPDDLEYVTPYDTTLFVRASIQEVVQALGLAIVLVYLVVFLFLQSWRATLIPAIAIPVSLVGTLAVMAAVGFSINLLSLLGLVLAVGLVVDDAIVVVENVERRMEEDPGAPMVEITTAAMAEVRGPIIATTVALMSVFVPIAFVPGLTGQLYNQFALTVAISVGLSGINSLTLSPALCALFLRPRAREPHRFFAAFNRTYERVARRYQSGVETLDRMRWAVVGGFVALVALTAFLLVEIPSGFVPEEDQGYFIITATGPEDATIQHMTDVVLETTRVVREMPNAVDVFAYAGYDLFDGIDQRNSAAAWVVLKNWDERVGAASDVTSIMARAEAKLAEVDGATFLVVNASPIPGLATSGGLNLELQDRSASGIDALNSTALDFIAKAQALPEIATAFTTFNASFPERFIHIDRVKALSLGIDLTDLFDTLQINLGSLYVNEFNKFGRVYDVYVQADAPSRMQDMDITALRVRNAEGAMIPLSAVVRVEPSTGPYNIPHYNLYPSVSINAVPAPGTSSGDARAALEHLADGLPAGYGTEWTGTVYQQVKAGNLAPVIFALSLAFVFLVLSAQFESFTLPFVVILAIPLGILGAIVALHLRSIPLDVFGQIGLVMLIGLTAKNAILIVQFAEEHRKTGASTLEAAKEASYVRLRPILMTAFAFILGVMPLAIASGAGAYSRQSMGTTVVGGMLLSTILVIVVPIFYHLIESWRERMQGTVGPGEEES